MSLGVSRTWKRKMMVQTRPRVRVPLPSTMSWPPMDSSLAYSAQEKTGESEMMDGGGIRASVLKRLTLPLMKLRAFSTFSTL